MNGLRCSILVEMLVASKFEENSMFFSEVDSNCVALQNGGFRLTKNERTQMLDFGGNVVF